MPVINQDERAALELRALYENYGYSRYKMSHFEEYDLYVANKDFLVSDEVITFSDRSGRLLALKPDVTLSIIKNLPDMPGAVQKLYYNENVYRVARGAQCFQEIMQVGLECIGDLQDHDVAEVVLLALKSLARISSRYLLDISHTGLIHAVLLESGLSQSGIDTALACLRDKNGHELSALCRTEGICDDSAQKLMALCEHSGAPEAVLPELRGILTSPGEQRILNQMDDLCCILSGCGFGAQVRVDFSVGNDLKYYSGFVFKGYVEGIPTGILSGGQYDRLLQKMGRKSRAIGFAVYTDLLSGLPREKAEFDVDTLILHEPGEAPALVIAEAEKAAASGSVLVCRELPQQRTWRRLVRIRNGKVEDDG